MRSVVDASVASVALAVVLASRAGAAAPRAEAGGGSLAGMVLDRPLARSDLGLQACPRAHRTPVLEPHVKARTNKACSPTHGEGGTACRVVQCEFETVMDSNFFGCRRYCTSRCFCSHRGCWESWFASKELRSS